jgi:hypothetical protein
VRGKRLELCARSIAARKSLGELARALRPALAQANRDPEEAQAKGLSGGGRKQERPVVRSLRVVELAPVKGDPPFDPGSLEPERIPRSGGREEGIGAVCVARRQARQRPDDR